MSNASICLNRLKKKIELEEEILNISLDKTGQV